LFGTKLKSHFGERAGVLTFVLMGREIRTDTLGTFTIFPATLILPDHRRRQREELMSTQYTVALSVIAGLALGAAGVEALHAQAKPVAYTIVFNTVNDQEKYMNEFGPAITKSLQDAGGKYLVRGGKTIPMHGAPPAARVVVVQFESVDKAQAWAASPAAKAAYAIGEKYATLNDFIVEGVSP
jgi:uncharacterized protein (DUF1330 family)